jgi:hypothetical protein
VPRQDETKATQYIAPRKSYGPPDEPLENLPAIRHLGFRILT